MRFNLLLGLGLVLAGIVVFGFGALVMICGCAAVSPDMRPAVRMNEVVTLTGLGMVLVGAILTLWTVVRRFR